MPKVTLIDFTGKMPSVQNLGANAADFEHHEKWHAADLLLFTKGTRLEMDPCGLASIESLPEDAKILKLREMAATIPSSWEFVDVTFLLEGVTRVCAQQITRTRIASYSMQSQRVVDLTDGAVTNPYSDDNLLHDIFRDAADASVSEYSDLLALGAEPQDARGLLPMNIQCNLLAKYNLRSWVDLFHSRGESLRTQGEYSEIVRQEAEALKAVWPWVHIFLESPGEVGFRILENTARELGVHPGAGPGWQIAKALDLLRRATK